MGLFASCGYLQRIEEPSFPPSLPSSLPLLPPPFLPAPLPPSLLSLSLFFFLLFILPLFNKLFICVYHRGRVTVHVEVRRQLCAVSFLLPPCVPGMEFLRSGLEAGAFTRHRQLYPFLSLSLSFFSSWSSWSSSSSPVIDSQEATAM